MWAGQAVSVVDHAKTLLVKSQTGQIIPSDAPGPKLVVYTQIGPWYRTHDPETLQGYLAYTKTPTFRGPP